MRNLKPLICVIVIITIASGCKKENGTKTGTHVVPNAVIINSGPVAADGCGWLVEINGTNEVYSPDNLSPDYQKDSLKVNVTYHILTTKLHCGAFNGGGDEGGITQIHLDAIAQ
jgi:hypothetical protein